MFKGSLKSIKKNLSSLIFFGASAAAFGSPMVTIDITLTPVGSFAAKTTSIKGAIDRKGDLLVAQKIEVDLGSLNSGIELRDEHMKKDYFETSKYPVAVLKSAKGKGGKFIGVLNLRQVDSKISGTYEIKDGLVEAKFKTRLSDYKIKKASYMGVGVGDEVSVVVNIPLKK